MPVIGKTTITMNDDSNEVSSMTVNVEVVDAGNFAAQETLRDDFIAAVNGLSLGANIRNISSNCDRVVDPSTLGTGRREIKLEIQYADTVTFDRNVMLLPVFDESLRIAGTDDINTALPAWTQFVTDAEAYVLSPKGNAINIISGALVGRNI